MALVYRVTHEIKAAHDDSICHLSYIYGGKMLVSASLDCTVCFWDVASGKLVHCVVHDSAPICLLWDETRGSEELLVGYKDGLVCCVRLKKSTLYIRGFWNEDAIVERLALSKNRLRLAVGYQSAVQIWERKGLADNDQWIPWRDIHIPDFGKLDTNQDILVTSVHWMPSSNNEVLTSYLYHGIIVWDINKNEVLRKIMIYGIVWSSISPFGQSLVISTMRKRIKVYQFENWDSELFTISRSNEKESVIPVLYAHGGQHIVAGSSVGRVGLWESESGTHSQCLRDSDRCVLAISEFCDLASCLYMIATGTSEVGKIASIKLWKAINT